MAGRLQNSSHAFPPCNLQNLSLLDSLFKNSYTSNHSQSFAYLQMRFDLKAVTWGGQGEGGGTGIWQRCENTSCWTQNRVTTQAYWTSITLGRPFSNLIWNRSIQEPGKTLFSSVMPCLPYKSNQNRKMSRTGAALYLLLLQKRNDRVYVTLTIVQQVHTSLLKSKTKIPHNEAVISIQKQGVV